LLIIPLVLALLTIGFSYAQNAHSEQIAQDQQKQTTLDTYMDRMSDLLLASNLNIKLHDSKHLDQVRKVARARTLMALSKLDGERKRAVVLFIYQADLITWHNWPQFPGSEFPIITMTDADLSEADLHGIFLTNSALSRVLLNNANLSNTILSISDLDNADLRGADLAGAYLRGSNLSFANLKGANLSGAYLQTYSANLPPRAQKFTNLSGADLSKAHLSGADLSGANHSKANLSGANLSKAHLSGADLRDTIMPDGSKHS
jgi:uncharacterized protein YjbI with pentapeptide repeats